MQRAIVILTALSLFFISGSTADASRKSLTLGNGEFSSTITFDGRSFEGVSFTDTRTGEVLGSSSGIPLFEFCINGETVSSRSRIWRYSGEERTSLSNGGEVASYSFLGRGKYKGLHLVWDREFFPEGAFVRERLRLRSDAAEAGAEPRFRLTNADGRNHFVFPQYTLKAGAQVLAEELRIGTFKEKRNMTEHHMFHPDSLFHTLGAEVTSVKGPFMIMDFGGRAVWTAYEHASQDRAFIPRRQGRGAASTANDGLQDTTGDMDDITDDLLWFISTDAVQNGDEVTVGNHIRRGGYLDGEPLAGEWYETVWSVISFERSVADVNASIGEYLMHRITDNAVSRDPDFYYNTWGMQRDCPNEQRYTIMTEQRLLEEIDRAAECGVQTFVLDDGWQQEFGDWTYNRERLPNGLKPLVDRMKSYGMTPGIWMSLVGAGKQTQRTLEHPEWIIRDRQGEPILAQWGNPVYDIVGPFYDVLLSDIKALIDDGFRFFKWDGINLFSSDLCGLGHGDRDDDRRARMDRYNYLFPFYVTRLMLEMREYCPDVVVEIDLTEKERTLVGLQVLQEGKYYFINNGASVYRDYTSKRTKSVRSTINEYSPYFPQELFTYAVYPRDDAGFLEYNITTALQAGHGIWGSLEPTSTEDRALVRDLFDKAKRVLPHVRGILVERKGTTGSSPETYVQRNPKTGYALFTAFSSANVGVTEHISLDGSRVLGVMGLPFTVTPSGVDVPLQFSGERDESRVAFVIGKEDSSVSVVSSTVALDRLDVIPGGISVTASAEGDILVLSDGAGEPRKLHLLPGQPVSVTQSVMTKQNP